MFPSAACFHVSIKGETPYKTMVPGKWAKQSLVDVVIVPFLKTLQKDGKLSPGHTLQMVSGVTFGTTPISLNHDGLNVHRSLAELFDAASNGCGSNENPVPVEISMHSDGDKVKPRFLHRVASSLHVGPPPFKVFVYIGEYAMGTELHGKWQTRPALESLVVPFLEHYNTLGLGPKVAVDDVVGLAAEGIVSPTGADALKAPAKSLGGMDGAPAHVHLIVRGSEAAAEARARAGTPRGSIEGEQALIQASSQASGQGSSQGEQQATPTRSTAVARSPSTAAMPAAVGASPGSRPGSQVRLPPLPPGDNPLLRILDDIKYEQI